MADFSEVCGEELLGIVNELLPAASAEGAYGMGLVCALSWELGRDPPRVLLQAVHQVETIGDAVELVKEAKLFSELGWREGI